MLAAEPSNIQQFVAQTKEMLVTYHSMPRINSLSLIELAVQSKGEKWERTLLMSGLLRMGPLAFRYLPSSLAIKTFDKLMAQYLRKDLFNNNLSATISASKVRDLLEALLELTGNATRLYPGLDEASSFKMHRLLWVLAFFTRDIQGHSLGVYPFAALYPLLDDILDSPMYSKLYKTRLMERVHRRLDALYKNVPEVPLTPPASAPTSSSTDKDDARIDECVDALTEEIAKHDPFTRKAIIESLDTLRYAEELDYLDDREIDAYTQCAVKGTSTLKTLLLVSSIAPHNLPRWDELMLSYGFIFQMIDDLQDCQSDASNNICTPFSTLIRQSVNLDAEVIRLIQFVKSSYIDDLVKDAGYLQGRLRFINSILLYLIMEAAMKNRVRLSVQLYKDIRHRLPITKRWSKKHSLERETAICLHSIGRSMISPASPTNTTQPLHNRS